MDKESKKIIDYGLKMFKAGLTSGTSGNISTRLAAGNLMAITPSGISYEEITLKEIILLEIESGKYRGGQGKASSEEAMHRLIYQKRPQINALVHCHSVYASAYSCLGKTLPAVHYLIAVAGVDVPCAEYAPFGTVELAENVLTAMAEKKACLLANHGLIAAGRNLSEAYSIAETIEFCCQIYCHALTFGQPNILPLEEMQRMLVRFENYSA